MELLLLGLAAMFCSPLLDKKDDKKGSDDKKGANDRVIVVVIDSDGKPKADK